MKIQAGILKHMPIEAPKSSAGDRTSTRPTNARARQAILNSLTPRIEGASVADFFAGTGAMGLEALSRGAHSCLFAENDRKAQLALQANLTEAKRRFQAQGLSVPEMGVCSASLEHLDRLKMPLFDIIFADPPYQLAQKWFETFSAVIRGLLKPEGVFLLEHHKDTAFNSDWPVFNQRHYGIAHVSVFTV